MTTEKKVTLRFEVADSGAAQQLNKIAEGANKAAAATNNMKTAMVAAGKAPAFTPTGGGIGNFFQSPATRDQLILEAMRSRNYPTSGMSPLDLVRMSDQQLVDMKKNMPATPAKPAPSGWLGKAAAVANGGVRAGLEKYGAIGAIAAGAISAGPATIEGFHQARLVGDYGGTYGMQARAFANSTALGRTTLGSFDSVRGREQDFQRVDNDAKFRAIQNERDEEKRQNSLQVRMQRIAIESRAGVLTADRRMAMPGSFDRSTVVGERDWRESQEMLAPRQGVIDREKELKMAEDEKRRRQQLFEELDRRSRTLTLERNELVRGANETGGADAYRLRGRAVEKNELLEKAQDEMKQLKAEINDAERRIVGARAEMGRAHIDVMRTGLDQMGGRVATAEGQAERLGSMNPIELQRNVMAAQIFKSNGLEMLPPSIVDMASQVIPTEVRSAKVKRGVDAVQEFGLVGKFDEYRDKLPDARKDFDKQQADLIKALGDLERKTAAEAAVKVSNEQLIEAFNKLADAKAAAKDNKARQEILQSMLRDARK